MGEAPQAEDAPLEDVLIEESQIQDAPIEEFASVKDGASDEDTAIEDTSVEDAPVEDSIGPEPWVYSTCGRRYILATNLYRHQGLHNITKGNFRCPDVEWMTELACTFTYAIGKNPK